MRYIKLIISLVIGLVGFGISFAAIPKFDEEKIITVAVDDGANVDEDVYFEGYDPDDYHFVYQNGKTQLESQLPFLEQLDRPTTAELSYLLDSYPNMVSDILFNTQILNYHFLDSEDYLMSSYFNFSSSSYNLDTENIHLEILNKKTNELEADTIKRENKQSFYPSEVRILSMYQEYPTVKTLFTLSKWDESTESYLMLGEYNFETKNYTEQTLKQINGMFESYLSEDMYRMVSTNNEQVLVPNDEYIENYSDEEGSYVESQISYSVVNFTNNTLTDLDNSSGALCLTSDTGELYSLSADENNVYLKNYNPQNYEVANKHELATDERMNLQNTGYESLGYYTKASVVNNKLYIIYPQEIDYMTNTNMIDTNNESAFAIYQIFDTATGEELSSGEFLYDDYVDFEYQTVTIENIGRLPKVR